MEIESGNSRLLSKMATSDQHGENSPYFDGWKAYDNNPFHPKDNPHGVIQMGLAENQLSTDMIEEWIDKNPKASITTREGVHAFRNIALYQDYHGLPEFRNGVAKFMSKARGGRVSFDPDRIVMGGGATGASELLMFCLADSGDGFLVPSPYYPGFDRDLRWRTGVQLLPVMCQSSNNFKITKEALEEAFDQAQKANIKVKGLMIANPSNPLGTTLDRPTLKSLVTFINERQIHLVCDEIYAATAFRAPEFISVSEIIEEVECNRDLIHIVYSLSKDMGLPGFRVGIMYSYNDVVVDRGRKMSSFGLVSSQTQHLLATMLSDEEFTNKFMLENTRRLANRHEMFTKGLEEVGITCLESNAGLFCWMDLRHLLKEPTFEGEMGLWRVIITEVKLNVSPGMSFHCHEPGWFRVCFANMDDETLKVALTRIRVFVAKGSEVDAKVKKPWQMNLRLSFSSRIYDETMASSPRVMSPHSPLVRAWT
ncbi:1-aminocyclopropane-1-carboxylate synthase-like protein 1 [Striga hermonthica]|uniref:1-aminocyclopropane-1-carboxylate synthase-like protein 1 n=1 Tax=Striga hermonthica TaxID=68872 RepID=A0A9N7R8W1_STRHE|nr:1-aminocyclopropane-1-carboxylate synthase-like protein 1 [Striga hermonthica]